MLTLRSPAKVNLFLKIVSKRPDGYHNLASLFQAIDLCDILHFKNTEQDRLLCSDPHLPVDGSNLIQKAVRLFKEKTGLKQSFEIRLEKNIPYEAGLGGGSSNAAMTLWALNELTRAGASLTDLIQWGSELGSDVPFFFSSGTAYCTGRGEVLTSLPSLKPQKIVIAKPEFGLATPLVYRNLKLENLPVRDPQECLAGFYSKAPCYFNDLEAPAFLLKPMLAALKEQLLASGFVHVVLCGSGSALLCIGDAPIPKLEGVRFINTAFTEILR